MSTLVPMAGCLRYFCAMKMCSPIQRRNSTRGSSYSVLTRNSRRGHAGSSKIVYGAKGKIYNSDYNKTPMILRLAVEFITEILRSFSARGNRTLLSRPSKSEEVIVNDIHDVICVIKSDYEHSYFLTGNFTKSIYAEDCCFVDPTIKFKGRDLYQRNLQLLVPFFLDPCLVLCSIKEDKNNGKDIIEAKWKLRTRLKLPWRPLISLEGFTIYDLDANLKIINHTETWNMSAFDAVKQIFISSTIEFVGD